MSLGSGRSGASSFKGSPATRQPAFAAGHQARYPASYTESIRLEDRSRTPAFPLPFGRRHLLLGRPVPARGLGFPYGRLTGGAQAAPHRTLTGFPRSTRMRYGRVGCPLYPGGDGVPTTIGTSAVAACRLPTAGPYHPGCFPPTRDVRLTRHQQGFSVIHPSGLPLACNTRSERAPSGFPLGFAPGRHQPRTPGRGQVWNTDPGHVLGFTPNLQSTNLLISCDIVSHRPHLPP